MSFPKKLYTEQYIDYYVKVNSASKSVSEMAVQLEYTSVISGKDYKRVRKLPLM